MCGIIGVVGKIQGVSLDAAVSALARRGPDDRGEIRHSGAILAHTRLAIIDLDTGHQPMQDQSGSLTLSFNGEIYNYKELRSQLHQEGYKFATQSDTEVILEAYRKWGASCVEKLDGMFALALWDEPKQELYLARDRFGEKPLYYSIVDDTLYFSSEIKGLLAAGVPAKIDYVSLDNYLALGHVPPWRSIYENIQPLPPAHYAVFKNGKLAIKKYWGITHEENNDSPEQAARVVQDLLADSVKSRLVADVEVGSFLSGGIDSGIVTALAHDSLGKRRLKTFSVGFEDFVNELPQAQELAQMLNTDHHAMQVETDLVQAFKETTSYYDEPFADSSSVPVQLLAKYARKDVTVAVSGDGGDEVFFGYGHYRSRFNLNFKRRVREIFYNPFKNYPYHLPQYLTVSDRRALLKEPSAVETNIAKYMDLSEARSDLQKINLIDYQLVLPGEMLVKLDRSTMMRSLEVRAPFLHPKLVQYVFNLPDEYKTNQTRGKLILEKAFGEKMPKGFFARKKQGFGAPINAWLNKPEFAPLLENLTSPSALINELLNPREVTKLVEAFRSSKAPARKVWTLLALEEWLKSHPNSL